MFEPLYVGTSAGDKNFWVTTYLWIGDQIDRKDLCPEAGLEISWLTEEQLSNEKFTPFAAYNRKVFEAYHTYTEGKIDGR